MNLTIKSGDDLYQVSWPNSSLTFCGIHTSALLCGKNDLRPDRMKMKHYFYFVDNKETDPTRENTPEGRLISPDDKKIVSFDKGLKFSSNIQKYA